MFGKNKQIRSKLVARVITEARCGFRIPMEETVTLLSCNIKKADLKKEWETEGISAIRMMLPDRNVLGVKSFEFQTLTGEKIEIDTEKD